MRIQQSLSGSWEFGIDPEGTSSIHEASLDRHIDVPMPWQAAFPDLQQYSGYAWYRRTIDLDKDWLAGEILLHFGAVDYWCQVFINDQQVGEHEGGYTPFTFAIRPYLREGKNVICLRVYDSAQNGILTPRWPNYSPDTGQSGPPFNAEDIPHGKQEWYINAGGIWQDVSLVAVPQQWIDHVRITPNIHTGEAVIEVALAGNNAAGEGRLAVRIGEGGPVQLKLEHGRDKYTLTVRVENPRLWSLEDPHLYTATVAIYIEDKRADELAVRFGFREIGTRNGKITLNGEPIYLLSALDQDMYPETIYTVPSEEFLRDEFNKAKAAGLNCLRCHIKPPDPVYLDLADEMGILVWAEIPSWRTFYVKGTLHKAQRDLNNTIKDRVEATLREMIRRDFNHPSLVIWTIVNEDWGTTLPLSASDRQWVSEMYKKCKALDPTRLVVDNSPCPHPWGPNIHVRTDLDDFHYYANIPDQAAGWETAIEHFNMRPLWTFSNHGDAQRTGEEPLILSEFGNWGLPSLEKLRAAHNGADPPWFNIGPWWSAWEGEAGWPAGVDDRFRQLGLDRIWGSYEAFAEAAQWHQFNALKFEIEVMRRHANISGYVITELADIYWESNGLLDFYRNTKIYHDRLASINSPDMIVPQIASYAFWDSEQPKARLFASHYSGASWEGARLNWALGGNSSDITIPDIERGGTLDLGEITLPLPHVSQAGIIQAQFSIDSPGGQQFATNKLELAVYPSAFREAAFKDQVAVLSGNPAERYTDLRTATARSPLEESLHAVGYNTVGGLTSGARLAVTDRPDPQLLRWVRSGGDLLLIARGPSPFFWVHSRGGAYSGSWLTSYSWVRPDVHRRLHITNPLGMPFRHCMPLGTIVGLPVEERSMQNDFLAGMVSGWVGHPAVHTVQFRYGKGRVVMTTFDLGGKLGSDPVATTMFHDLVEHLASEACQPTLVSNLG